MENITALLGNLVFNVPLYDESVWKPLQEKKFKEAAGRLHQIVSRYRRDSVKEIFWESIIQGIPQVRGKLTQEEWDKDFFPYLATILLEIGDAGIFERIYFALDYSSVNYLHSLALLYTEGETLSEKASALEKTNRDFARYFLGTPLNAVIHPVIERPESAPLRKNNEVLARFNQAPDGIMRAIVSRETAYAIADAREARSLSDANLVRILYALLDVLLGFTDTAPLERLSEEAGVKNEMMRIVTPTLPEIEKFRESYKTAIEQEVSVPVKAAEEKTESQPIKITKVAFPSVTEEKKSAAEPNAPARRSLGEGGPFILHKEQDIAAGSADASSPFKKGSIFSFGFFKPGGKRPEEKREVSVKIESPEKTQEKPSGPAPLPAVKPPEPKIITVQTEAEKIKPPTPVTDIPKPRPVKVQDYAATSAAPATPLTVKTAETKPEPPKAAPTAETPMASPSGDKKVHYSAFKTDIPQNTEIAEKPRDPHVDGNTIFFK